MPKILKSSEVQQNFGRAVDEALVEGDVIVERYGEPRVVILSYHRYRQLLEAERALSGLHLIQPDRSVEAKQRGQSMAQQVRDELKTSMSGSLDETMASLRGCSWS
ncbi:MAG TPA: type II toxin-antitoxin system Phd/YefM family antitoxin [Anaerolineae bacterium]